MVAAVNSFNSVVSIADVTLQLSLLLCSLFSPFALVPILESILLETRFVVLTYYSVLGYFK